ncbi:hypothetical protein PNOK_0623200 [Pyrrhoderma noxium]|uniref:Uncharacterized protein n=1 Tax=Pyrrhoderma noxium TaxID=2282107 RepID=A0A286UDS3_9AGAM|nr:hypothetical protein PNOK_0623200 [Pyrrhoderma noxium]
MISPPTQPSMKSSKSVYYFIQVLKADTTGLCKKRWRSRYDVSYVELVFSFAVSKVIGSEGVVMKSNMPKIFRDAVPGIDAFSNAVERIVDAHPYLKLAWGITTALYDVVRKETSKRCFDGILYYEKYFPYLSTDQVAFLFSHQAYRFLD